MVNTDPKPKRDRKRKALEVLFMFFAVNGVIALVYLLYRLLI